MNLRDLTAEAIGWRAQFASLAGKMFSGRRDFYRALGYPVSIRPEEFRAEYRRNAVANRIVKALPVATWRGGGEVIEDENPDNITQFEQAFIALDQRLKIWDKLRRADVLAGIGRYAILMIGAPGDVSSPLVRVRDVNDIVYLTPYAESDATIQSFDVDPSSPRFGLPQYYSIKRTSMNASGQTNNLGPAKKVHYSRVLHISDGLLDDNVYGEPRLECVWNRLMDLEKVVGGGAEAFWRRADQGMQFDLDPTLTVTPEQKEAMKVQIEEYKHDLNRYLTTRGVKIESLGSDVADFKSPVDSIMSLISAGTGIPQRVLMGSEQGKLAAKQDRANWDNRVTDRQSDFAGPLVMRPLLDRFIEIDALPAPAENYIIRFSSITTMDDEQRANIASAWAGLNQDGHTVVTDNEIREHILDLPPLTEAQRKEAQPPPAEAGGGRPDFPVFRKKVDLDRAAATKGGAPYEHIHRAADYFRTEAKARRLAVLRGGKDSHGRALAAPRVRTA